MEKNIEKLKLRMTYAMWREYARKITSLTLDIEAKKKAFHGKEGGDLEKAITEVKHLKKVRKYYSGRAKTYKKDFRTKNRSYSMKKKGEQ